MNLKNLKVEELSTNELRGVEVGKIPWGRAWKHLERAVSAIGLDDAADRFVARWNSENCGCNKI